MKICVFGAGAIGGNLAACFARGGAEVSVVARGAYLAAIRARGITIEEPGGTFMARIRASDDPGELGAQDAVVVTVKAPALPAVAASIAPLLGPATPVAFAMNGIPWFYFDHHGGRFEGHRLARLDPGEALRRAVGPERALAWVIYCACTVLEPGRVQVEHAHNRIVAGEPDDSRSARAEALAEPLRRGGLTVETAARMRDAIWTKLLLNWGSGPLAVLTASPPAAYAGDPAIVHLIERIVTEGQAVAEALGARPEVDLERQIARSRAMSHKPSILQDLELGRPMEIDGIFTATTDLARLAGVATPTLDLVVAMLQARARAAGLYS